MNEKLLANNSPILHVWYVQDPLLRRSGMFTIAMAYCGSGNNSAIRRLLHVAVSRLLGITGIYVMRELMTGDNNR